MEFFGFEIVDELPALYSEDKDLIVISDLHLGLEGNITYEGGYVPKFQLEHIKQDLKDIAEITDASKIVINGDLKHEFSTTRFSEKKEIENFLDLLEDLFDEVIIVKGNHDTFLENLTNTRKTVLKENYVEGKTFFTHGHKLPENIDDHEIIVIGHEHPALVLEDEIGISEKVDCFLYGETCIGNLVVLPAFSKISGGSKVNQIPKKEFLSPVLKQVEVGDLKAVAISREAGEFEFPELKKIK